MALGILLTAVALVLQSAGKVLYGSFLDGVPTPVFVFLGVALATGVFLAAGGARLPANGRRLLVATNVWTAICFISVFYALKHLTPALFASIEIGMALITAILLTAVQGRHWPPMRRLLASAGIIAGGALVAFAEMEAGGTAVPAETMWTAIVAAMATGVTTALAAASCRKLGALGWSSATVLGHRFYLTIAAAAAWIALDGETATVGLDGIGVAAVLAIAAVGIVAPLLLLQVALRRIDALTLMVCLAAQPLLSFALSLPSPAYTFDVIALAGVAVVTAFVAADIAAQRRGARPAPPAVPKAAATA